MIIKTFYQNVLNIIFVALSVSIYAQGGKVNKDGLRDGKWEIVYEIKNTFSYIGNSDIPDWLNSITPSSDNGSAMINSANRAEIGSSNTKYILEKCKYEDGIKNGKFTLIHYSYEGQERIDNSIYSNSLATRAKWTKTEVVSGEYLNGKINGTLVSFMNNNTTISIKYKDGIIEDQTIKINQVVSSDKKFVVNPYYNFKNGYLSETMCLKNNVPTLIVFDGSKGKLLHYTPKPICYNYFSFLTKNEKQQGERFSLIDLNTNNFAIECIPFYYSNSGELIVHGNYRLFKPAATLTDTSFLWASYQYKDDVRDGLAEIWDASENGKTGVTPSIKQRYLKDKLHGYSEMFYRDGKLAVSAEFKNGYVDGEVITYNYPPNHYPFELKYHIKPYVLAGQLSIYQIGEYSDKTLQENIKIIKENGGAIETPKQYEQYTKVRYKVDSMQTNGVWFKGSVPAADFYQFYNGKPIVKYIINKEKPWIPSEIIYFDSNGTVVYSLSKAKNQVVKKAAELEAEQQKYLNTEISCASCNKNILIKNAIEQWDGCKCIKEDGSKITVGFGGKKFCSIQCKVIFEKDCCKSNGYYYER
jgi:antitoxin component YwqK of YwqJK toxin-antitoxin module